MKQELNEEEDYYFNDKGLITFTAQYLLDRGYCCGNGCLHCPYDYKAVPEPKRSFLLKKREEGDNSKVKNQKSKNEDAGNF
jgi:hypothetical protein